VQGKGMEREWERREKGREGEGRAVFDGGLGVEPPAKIFDPPPAAIKKRKGGSTFTPRRPRTHKFSHYIITNSKTTFRLDFIFIFIHP